MLFVFDLDGTLCFDGETISEDIKTSLKTAERFGHRIAFATARSYRDCLKVLGDDLSQETVIGLNGGLAYRDGRIIYHNQIDQQAYKAVLSWCQRRQLPFFIDDELNYSGQEVERFTFYRFVDPLGIAKQLAVEEMITPIKMVVDLSKDEDFVDDMCQDLFCLNQLTVFYHDVEKYLYITPRGTTKAEAVKALYHSDFVAFGNDDNDRNLFEQSTYSVQVGNYASLMGVSDEQIPADNKRIAQKIRELFKTF